MKRFWVILRDVKWQYDVLESALAHASALRDEGLQVRVVMQ